jgi:hypothetical protein
MANVLIFAVNARDALVKCNQLGVPFEEVTWVMNYQLLGGGDYSHHQVFYTEAFKNVPAYAEAYEILGDGPQP